MAKQSTTQHRYVANVTARTFQPQTHKKWLEEYKIPHSVIGQKYFFRTNEDALCFSLVWG